MIALPARHRPHLARVIFWSVAAALLVAPAVAMLFTREVSWDGFDFLMAAIILAGIGLSAELAGRLFARRRSRMLAIGLLAIGGVLVWIEAAVGILPSDSLLGGS